MKFRKPTVKLIGHVIPQRTFCPIWKMVVWQSIAFIAEGTSKRCILSEVGARGQHASLLQLPPHDQERRPLVLNPLEREDHLTTQHRVEENRRHVAEVPNTGTARLHTDGDAGASIALELVGGRGEIVPLVEVGTGQGDCVDQRLHRRSAS